MMQFEADKRLALFLRPQYVIENKYNLSITCPYSIYDDLRSK